MTTDINGTRYLALHDTCAALDSRHVGLLLREVNGVLWVIEREIDGTIDAETKTPATYRWDRSENRWTCGGVIEIQREDLDDDQWDELGGTWFDLLRRTETDPARCEEMAIELGL